MKYIDADKLISEIEKWSDGKLTLSLLTEIKGIISSLQQEQPSLPSNLDEAAEEYAREKNPYGCNAFKAGAEWMAGQGWSRELEVKEDAGGYPYIDKHIELYDYDTDEPLAKKGDKVVVQIRKK